MHDDPTLPIDDSQPVPSGAWGRFRLLALVGSGGFGQVYRVWDPDLQREVALKLLLPGAVDGDAEYETMLREARAMASVQHPNVVHVYGIERHDGRVGFWTDFVNGKTLRDLLNAQGPFGYREAALIGADISRALGAVHRAGLLHRDIKAENVMREDGGRILLMDFGLSAGARSQGFPISGTPNYMAPELFDGAAATVRTDIYAMGVLLYYLVVGDYPVRITGLTAGEAKAALARRKPLMDLRCELPESFLRTVRIATDLDPEKRFASAGELAESLAASLETTVAPVPSSVSGGQERPVASLIASRSTAWRKWTAIAAVLLVCIAGLVAALWMRHKAASPAVAQGTSQILAILPIANNTADPGKDALADGFTDDLIRQLSETPHLKVISRTSIFRYRGPNVDAHSVGQALHASSIMTGNMQRSGNRIVVNVELSDVASNAVVLSRQYFAEDADLRPVRADIAHDLADVLKLNLAASESASTSSAAAYQAFLEGVGVAQGGAPPDLHQASKNFEKAVALDPKFSLAWGALGDVHALLGLYFEAPKVQMPIARRDVEQAIKLDPTRSSFHGTLGLIHLVYDWDYPAAAAELASADSQADAFHALSCTTHLMHEAGKSRHAEDLLNRMEQTDPESVSIVSELGCVAYYRGDYQQAIDHYRDAMKLDSHSPIPYWGLGKSLTQQGRFRESIQALQQFKATNGFEPPLLTAEIGYALARAGRVAEAKQQIRNLEVEGRSGYVDAYLTAIIYLGLHDKETTYAWLGKAFDDKSPFLISILTEPKWGDSRSDPRFQSIVARMNLSQSGRN